MKYFINLCRNQPSGALIHMIFCFAAPPRCYNTPEFAVACPHTILLYRQPFGIVIIQQVIAFVQPAFGKTVTDPCFLYQDYISVNDTHGNNHNAPILFKGFFKVKYTGRPR